MGEKRFCVICDKDVEIDKVLPHEDYDEQILSCGHFGRRINRTIEEKAEIKDEVKPVAIDHTYGQVYTDKTTKDSKSNPCKCGHRGNQHKFLKDYTGNHNCYLCECTNYNPA
jgi:hypothetical protein